VHDDPLVGVRRQGAAEHLDLLAFVRPEAEREHLLVGVPAQDDRVHRAHELVVPGVTGPLAPLGQPVDRPVGARDESVQAGRNENRGMKRHAPILTG
jgi:hypothetical protein